jgi:transposase
VGHFSPPAWVKSTPPSTSAPPETLKAAAQANEPVDDGALAVIVVTYGYSRDYCEDLKQWMLALVTSAEGVPQFLQPLDGNASDKRALLAAVTGLRQ